MTEASLKYIRIPETVAADMGGDTVMLDVESGTYYGIEGAGNLIWRKLEVAQDLASLRDLVCAAFDVAPERASTDAQAFLGELLKAGLIRPA